MTSTNHCNSFVCLKDFETEALKILSSNAVDFYARGANDEVTLRDNVAAFKRWKIRPRMLRNVSSVDLSTSVLGHSIDFPVCIAPTGYHGLAHLEAELGTARGAANMKTIFTLSSHCNTSMEDLQTHVPDGIHFFQFYTYGVPNKRSIALEMMKKAAKNGFKASVITLDLPVLGNRYGNMRKPFQLPPHLRVPILDAIHEIGDHFHAVYDTNLTWDDIKWLQVNSPLPLIVKGILTAEDALLALNCGVSGIIVSNHGGRQLDSVFSTIDVLSEVVAAVAGRCEVYLDGGIRHGTDVFKALALGARAVFIGRPALYGLACNGSSGVKQVLKILKNELSTAMALAGCGTIAHINSDMVVHEQKHWAKL